MDYFISDKVQAFMSRILKNLMERIGVTHIRTNAFHPQSNRSERINSSISAMISQYCSTNHKDWDQQLSSITLAINTQFHISLHNTPFFLMFGRMCKLPGDIPVVDSTEEDRRNRWEVALDLARENIKRSQQINKKYYDKRHQHIMFKVGDKVMCYYPNRKVGLATKLMHFYKGPFEVTGVRSSLVYEI